MPKNILDRATRNNGYRCSCCGHSWESCDWTEESVHGMLTLFEVFCKAKTDAYDEGIDSRQYEKDGNVLYGYIGSYTTRSGGFFDGTIVIGNREWKNISKYETFEEFADMIRLDAETIEVMNLLGDSAFLLCL